jgi:hypothetical protein
MATNQSSEVTQKSRKNTLNQNIVNTVTMYWDDIVSGLPMPGYAWRWSETDLPFRCLYRLNEYNLLNQSDVGRKHWETTERLWLYVISRSSDDEAVGCRIGQKVLDAPPDSDQDGAWRQIRTPPTGDQMDLTGTIVGEGDQDDEILEQKLAMNESKDPTWARKEDGVDPKQLTLVEVCALSQAGNVSTLSVCSFARSVGQVYHSSL